MVDFCLQLSCSTIVFIENRRQDEQPFSTTADYYRRRAETVCSECMPTRLVQCLTSLERYTHGEVCSQILRRTSDARRTNSGRRSWSTRCITWRTINRPSSVYRPDLMNLQRRDRILSFRLFVSAARLCLRRHYRSRRSEPPGVATSVVGWIHPDGHIIWAWFCQRSPIAETKRLKQVLVGR